MKKLLIIVGAVVIAGIAYYALSPLFRNVELNEALPGEESAQDVVGNGEQQNLGDSTPTAGGTQPVAITDTPAHPASGTARIVVANGKNYLRYEDFKTINGPDLYVYLSKDIGAKEFVSLGKAKATEGNVNYEIPENINPEDYPYALVWCEQFGVLFNSAKLY